MGVGGGGVGGQIFKQFLFFVFFLKESQVVKVKNISIFDLLLLGIKRIDFRIKYVEEIFGQGRGIGGFSFCGLGR